MTVTERCNRQVLFHKWKIVYRLQTAKDILNEAIALNVRKKLNDDIENIRRKEYNSDSTQYKKHP